MDLSISELIKAGKAIRDELYAHGQYSWGSLNHRNMLASWLNDLEQAIQEHPELKKNYLLRGNLKSLRGGLESDDPHRGPYRGYDSAMQSILSISQQSAELPPSMPTDSEPPRGTEHKLSREAPIKQWVVFAVILSLTSLFLWFYQRCLDWPWLNSHERKTFIKIASQLLLIFGPISIPLKRHWKLWLYFVFSILLAILLAAF